MNRRNPAGWVRLDPPLKPPAHHARNKTYVPVTTEMERSNVSRPD
jgi:hypothetical protein